MNLRPNLCVLLAGSLGTAPAFALPHSDLAGLREAYAASRRSVVADGTRHLARNPEQGFSASFDGRGVRVRPDDGAWEWGLDLVRFGAAGHECAVDHADCADADGSRLSRTRAAGLVEWYENGAAGLEHGFTVTETPEGDGLLSFVLAIRGSLAAEPESDGLGARFVDERLGAVLAYRGLAAFDADGRSLPAGIEVAGGDVTIRVDARGARAPIVVDPILQQVYLKASNTNIADYFGHAVAISGDTAVIGAYQEDSNATGVNGNQSDNTATNAGAAYVFVRSGTAWTQQAYLKASNTDAFDAFGTSVAISGDTIVVGAPWEDSNATGVNGNQSDNSLSQAGAAYVFVRSGTTWTQQAYLKAPVQFLPMDYFGQSVAISGDTVVVGAFDKDDGLTLDTGAAYVFVRSGSTWAQQAALLASNRESSDAFGWSVAISGDTAIVGAYGEDSNASGVNGNQADNSMNESGAAYVFVRAGTAWSQQAYLKASNPGAQDQFGESVAISGDIAVVGAFWEQSNATGVNGNQNDNSDFGAGAAYVFVRSGSTWTQEAYLKASNTQGGQEFGHDVAIDGATVVIGATGENSNATGVNGNQNDHSMSNAGAAYQFVRSGTTWSQAAYLKASNTFDGYRFGCAVAVSGGTTLIGSDSEASNATGVNGNQANTSAADSGAAYAFLSFVGGSLVPFCAGDGTGVPCPCANTGAAGHGCDNGQPSGTGGALLAGSGLASVAADSLSLDVTNTLNHVHVLFEGTRNTASARYGAGVRCATSGLNGNGQSFLKRLAKGTAAGGLISFTGIAASSSAKGAPLHAGETYFYFVAYRNAEMNGAPGCPGINFGFNSTNSGAVTWLP